MSLAGDMKTSCALAEGCYVTASRFFHSTLSLAIIFFDVFGFRSSCPSLANVVDRKAKLEFV